MALSVSTLVLLSYPEDQEPETELLEWHGHNQTGRIRVGHTRKQSQLAWVCFPPPKRSEDGTYCREATY